jgi:hypothetical protein
VGFIQVVIMVTQKAQNNKETDSHAAICTPIFQLESMNMGFNNSTIDCWTVQFHKINHNIEIIRYKR